MSPFTYDITPEPEEDPVTEPKLYARSGPLTERQFTILAAIAVGEQYDTIAERLGYSRQVITNDVSFAAKKMGCRTNREAVARYSAYLAYNRAAELLRGSKVVVPMDEAEVHVNHVLEELGKILSDRAAALLPQ